MYFSFFKFFDVFKNMPNTCYLSSTCRWFISACINQNFFRIEVDSEVKRLLLYYPTMCFLPHTNAMFNYFFASLLVYCLSSPDFKPLEDRDPLCLVHHSILNTYHSVWHIVIVANIYWAHASARQCSRLVTSSLFLYWGKIYIT